jgi:hypothetical protein
MELLLASEDLLTTAALACTALDEPHPESATTVLITPQTSESFAMYFNFKEITSSVRLFKRPQTSFHKLQLPEIFTDRVCSPL